MKSHLYLSLLPESLVASMLPPEEFGAYLAMGTEKQPQGPAMFFDVDGGLKSEFFNLSSVDERCVPHADGRVKNSLYISVYRVLEHVPRSALGSLWLTTAHGRSLELKQGQLPPISTERFHLYREICPVHPLIASVLSPAEFCNFITDRSNAVSVPRICAVELQLGGLAADPAHGAAGDLPYHNIAHIRACLKEVSTKRTKTVDRVANQAILYRCVKGGFFVGDDTGVSYYPYPTMDDMEGKYNAWWRCANDSELNLWR